MQKIKYTLPIIVFIISFIFVYLVSYSVTLETNTTINEGDKSSPYWLIFGISLPIILGILFPKLKRMGIGTKDFLPNLYNQLFKNK